MERIGWQAVRVGPAWGYRKDVPLIGPLLKFPRIQLPIPWEDIESIVRRQKPWLVSIEPYLIGTHEAFVIECARHGFFVSRTASIVPTTLHIDITQLTALLWKKIRPSTKTKVNKAQRMGIQVVQSDNIGLFVDLWTHAARKRGLLFPPKKEILALWSAFNPVHKATILLATTPPNRQNTSSHTVLAGILLVCSTSSVHYLYAFTTDQGRRSSVGSLLSWKALLWARAHGYQLFDFEGLYSQGKTPRSWQGFSFFKRGFGGQEVQFAGTFLKSYGLARLLPLRLFF